MKRRILLLTPFAPTPEGLHGSARAIHGLCSALAERHELLIVHLDQEAGVDSGLHSRCVAVEQLPVRPLGAARRRALALVSLARGRPQWAAELAVDRVRRRVAELGASFRPDVVQVEHAVLADALSGALPGALRVVTIYEPAGSWRGFAAWHEHGSVLAHRLDAAAAVRQERRALRLAHGAVVFTERDRRTVCAAAGVRTVPRAMLECIPLGWDVAAAALDPVGAEPPTVLFVGNFRHPPNREAALRLAGVIFPRVLDFCPEARLEIVGPEPPGALLACAGDRIRVPGAVPSLEPHLDRAAVVVAPLRLGGGMRVKVLEALAAGKAVVASPLANEGLNARDQHELLIADGDEDTARAIAGLLADPERRRQLGEAARAWALGELSWPTMAARYEQFYECLERARSGSATGPR